MEWSDTQSGYLHNPELSDEFRISLQASCRFRQFADVEDAIGKNRGETAQWNVYGDVATDGAALAENSPMPTTTFSISQGSCTVKEYGNSVPYTGKLEALSEHDIRKIVFSTLKRDCNKTIDRAAHAQFDNALIQYVGTGASAATITYDGTVATTNAIGLTTYHVKRIADLMEERNIPTFDGENYMSVARPTTLRPFKDDLEDLHKYVMEGWMQIINGETGRYEGIRFVQQTNIVSEAWSGGLSDAAYFFGGDTVTEVVACPEELRAKVGGDYGRDRGIAWYYLGAFGITHGDASTATGRAQARIVKWASNA